MAKLQKTYYHMITIPVKEKLETTCKCLICYRDSLSAGRQFRRLADPKGACTPCP